mmetsp:Transcript_19368/g.54380  ORF Transcript_19368/g.54380 Transcript_19368/m.54380 type:complete len:255 (-) Transcript_19368:1300-2064(-)
MVLEAFSSHFPVGGFFVLRWRPSRETFLPVDFFLSPLPPCGPSAGVFPLIRPLEDFFGRRRFRFSPGSVSFPSSRAALFLRVLSTSVTAPGSKSACDELRSPPALFPRDSARHRCFNQNSTSSTVAVLSGSAFTRFWKVFFADGRGPVVSGPSVSSRYRTSATFRRRRRRRFGTGCPTGRLTGVDLRRSVACGGGVFDEWSLLSEAVFPNSLSGMPGKADRELPSADREDMQEVDDAPPSHLRMLPAMSVTIPL